MFLVGAKPLETLPKLEVFNEICTSLLSYLMLVYTDFVDSRTAKIQISFVYITLFVFNIIVNILAITINTIREVIKIYKKWRHRRLLASRRIKLRKILPMFESNQMLLDSRRQLINELEVIKEENDFSRKFHTDNSADDDLER